MLGLTLNETCGMANIPQAWTLAAAGDIKWKNIVKQDSTIYSFETLGKRTEKGQVIEILYFPWMLKQTDLDTIDIFLRTEDNPNRRYVRIK